MSRDRLPEHLDLRSLAERRAVLHGTLPNSAMTRLGDRLAGETEAELRFDLDGARRPVITGWARTAVELECQRCLRGYPHAIEAEFSLVLVRDEAEAAGLSAEWDPLIGRLAPVSTAELVEDELILGLPIVALHPDQSACGEAKGEGAAKAAEAGEAERQSPFAVLARLKRNDD